MSNDSAEVTLVLGIPIDNLTLDSAVERTLALADAYRQDGRPRQIATVNVDFLTNTLGWTPNATPRHPELLEILRRADLVTADGMPIVWLAKLLGTELHERVAGSDMVIALARVMAKSGHSLFFLGGRGDIGQRAADKLVVQNPGLKVAGVYSPFVHIEGEASLESATEDEEAVAQINRVEPDVLLIGFGNPKQEIWFHRNRHRLKAGVSIGIGGTFEFVVGRVTRAPVWMQRSGLEWVYRISQDPKRLWKRYAVGLVKLGVLTLPLVLYYQVQRRLYGKRGQPAPRAAPASPGGAPAEQFRLTLPERADAAWVESQSGFGLEGASAGQWLVVDFRAARFIDSTALGYLTRLWKSAQNLGLTARSIGLEGSPVAGLLKMTRIWDLFAESTPAQEPSPAASEQGFGDGFAAISVATDSPTLARLHGRLDADQVSRLDLDGFVAALGEQDCILDLSDLQFVDSTGLRLFFRLQRHFAGRDQEMVLCNLQAPVRQLMEITRVTSLFRQLPSQAAAVAYLRERKQAATAPGADWAAGGDWLDSSVRGLYKVAYGGHLALNFAFRPKTRGGYAAVWHDGRVLLIRNSYKSMYSLPCGGAKPGEDPAETARRELREETGLELPLGRFHQAFETVNRSEFKEDHIQLYELVLDSPPELKPDPRELVWAGFRRPAEALELPLFPPVRDYLLQRMTAAGGA